MIGEQKRTVGSAKGEQPYQSTGTRAEPVAPTLKEVGIDYKLSSRSQTIAAIPEDDFEQTLSEAYNHKRPELPTPPARTERPVFTVRSLKLPKSGFFRIRAGAGHGRPRT